MSKTWHPLIDLFTLTEKKCLSPLLAPAGITGAADRMAHLEHLQHGKDASPLS